MTDPVTAARDALLDDLGPKGDYYPLRQRHVVAARLDNLIALARAEAGVSMTLPVSDELARTFHEQYERLAPSFGYVTRRDSSVPWEDVPAPNRSLMLAVATEVLDRWPALAALPDGWTLARAEAGVSVEEMGKAWAAVEAALPEHHYFKVEHDSDDDPSWYLAVWRSDGIFPDPIRWAQADTLLDGLTRLALELRTPR